MRCPRCGRGKLYDGLLKIADRCTVCDLNLSAEDSGDGAVAFVTMIMGGIAVAVALWMETVFAPPLWVHWVVLLPLILGGSLLVTRWLKATLVALQFRHRSEDYSEDYGDSDGKDDHG